MQVNFTSQSNYNHCSFGQCKFNVPINNHDNPLKLAYSIINVIGASPKAKVILQAPKEKEALEVSSSLFGVIEYCMKPEVNIIANSKFHRKYFTALKDCLKASSADEAEQISKKALEKLYKKEKLNIQG